MRTNAAGTPAKPRSDRRTPIARAADARVAWQEGRMKLLRRLWKRRVTGRPDRYQAYVGFPTESGRPRVGDVHDRIEELERVFEGRLDVYARTRGVAVVTDRVPSEEFDVEAFEAVLDRIEDVYAETHRLARLEKWRSNDGRLVVSYVVVPVRPLFPRDVTDGADRIPSPAD